MRNPLLAFTLVMAPCIVLADEVNIGKGKVSLLDGYRHEREQGIDSIVGNISRADGGLVIHYDIGALAGPYANPAEKEKYHWYKDVFIRGRQVICALERKEGGESFIVTFPTQGPSQSKLGAYPANFYAYVRTKEDIAELLLTVLSYREGTDEP